MAPEEGIQKILKEKETIEEICGDNELRGQNRSLN
jgi:hypothetical protein